MALDDPKKLPGMVAGLAKAGDLVVCLGAGSITAWANALPGDLDRLAGGTGRSGAKPTMLRRTGAGA